MSDAYRTAGHACPVCRIGMREFQGRLVCDQCGGMQLAVADLERQITASEQVSVIDDTGTQRACPRCERLMQHARVRLGKLELDAEILHCQTDGLWLGKDVLEDILTQIGKHSHRGAVARGAGLLMGGLAIAPRGGNSITAVDAAFSRGAGDPNEPLRWWEKPRPRVHTPFATALSAHHLACPTCAGKLHLHGDRWGCDAGDGVFVEYAALEAMLAEMANAPWETPAPAGPQGTRACPACSQTMALQEIEGVTVDRCTTHGIWFDTGELERALQHTGEPKTGWFRRVFWNR